MQTNDCFYEVNKITFYYETILTSNDCYSDKSQ